MDPRAEAERWLAQAENDLEFAEHGLRLGYHAQTCFLAQQVAEKAVKAVHYLGGARAVMGHSVAALLDRLQDDDAGALASSAAELDQYYVPARYPNGLPEPSVPFRTYTKEQAARALDGSRRIVDFVRRRVRGGGATPP